MINIKLIYKILGTLLLFEAAFIALCLGVSIFYREDDFMGFSATILIIFLGAWICRKLSSAAAIEVGLAL